MTFKEFFSLIYVRGYFESQPEFLLNLLKGSVEQHDIMSFTKPTLNGYIGGDSIGNLADTAMKVGINTERISKYIESLYDTKHKDTTTYQNRFNGKTYKEVLYEKVRAVFTDVTLNNMSYVLAECFFKIIEKAAESFSVKKEKFAN